MNQNILKISITLLVALIVYGFSSAFLSEPQARLIASIVFLVIMWTHQALHMGIVSLLPIIIFPLLDITAVNEVTTNYSNSIIFLFIGGFLLANATEKHGLHKRIAKRLLSLFPATPRGILYALIITTGMLSSFLSDTTTALLLMPLAGFLTDDRDLQFRLCLAVAYAAVIGGIITPIGTPPNLILLGFMESRGLEPINFVYWMLMMLPLAMIMLVAAAEVLLFGVKSKKLDLKENDFFDSASNTPQQKRLIGILLTLVGFLLINPLLSYWFSIHINEKLLFLAFGLSLFLPKIELLDWQKDFHKIPFAILFLFGAGFSIAQAFASTGLADSIANQLSSLGTQPLIIVLLVVATGVVFSTEITSNTALTSIALPTIFIFAQQIGIETQQLIILTAISASYAFMLPIATPPNAIAIASGKVRPMEMIKRGFFLNVLGIGLTIFIAQYYWVLWLASA